jgi:hypothetical protein
MAIDVKMISEKVEKEKLVLNRIRDDGMRSAR